MKKIISLFLTALLSFTLVAAVGCGGGGGGNVTQLNISTIGMGQGGPWEENLAKRFEEMYAKKSYADGKTGVNVEINDLVADRSDISTDGNAIYLNGAVGSPATYASSYLDLTDIVREDLETIDGETVTIEDKIPDDMKHYYQVNGSYYALPTEEYHALLAYDKHLFDENGLYFAKPGAEGRERRSTVMNQTYTLINIGDNASKSCGPDGEYNTDDDGLPSSLYELAALCDLMKSYFSISPFCLAGAYRDVCNALMCALMTSLQGFEANAMYNLEGESYEIITGWTDENLFPGVSGIKKPIVQTIPITEETGYYTTWSSAKYYAEAFVELTLEKGWWYSGTDDGNKSNIDAEADFIYSGYGTNESIGMMVEFTYWWAEAKNYNRLEYFYTDYPDVEEREVALMPFPVNVSESVTEGEGEAPSVLVTESSYLAVNKNIENDPEMLAVVKDFIKFMYTDYQLSYPTVEQGLPINMDYKIQPEHEELFEGFYASLWSIINDPDTNVVRTISGTNATAKANERLLRRGYTCGAFKMPDQLSCFTSMRDYGKTAKECFETQMVLKDQWASYYKGTGEVGDYNGIGYTK